MPPTERKRVLALTGWHRMGIVAATGWVLVVVGLAALEHHAGRLETGDGFFTCWEPWGSSLPAPAGLRCGLLPTEEVTPSAFESILPGVRYLNVPRFSAVLGGRSFWSASLSQPRSGVRQALSGRSAPSTPCRPARCACRRRSPAPRGAPRRCPPAGCRSGRWASTDLGPACADRPRRSGRRP